MSTSISVITNGTKVHGLITHRSHSDLTVTITSPIAGFSLGASHIPYFARSHKNYLDSQGDGLATELLKELYRIACYVLARKEQLQETRLQPSGLLEVLGNIRAERASITHKKRAAKKNLLRANWLSGITRVYLRNCAGKMNNVSPSNPPKKQNLYDTVYQSAANSCVLMSSFNGYRPNTTNKSNN